MTAPIGRRPYGPDDSDTAPVEEVHTRPTTRCGRCGLRAWFIDGCPNCRRITEVIHDCA